MRARRPGARLALEEAGLERDPRRVRQLFEAAVATDPTLSDLSRAVMATHLRAAVSYDPPVYPGRLTLFRVRTLSLLRAHDPEMGWGRLAAGGVEVRMIRGAHHTLLESPHVEDLAGQLSICLARGWSAA